MSGTLCKHCGMRLTGMVGDWVHNEGPQRGKRTCAIEPYGFEAAPSTEPCSHICYAVWGKP